MWKDEVSKFAKQAVSDVSSFVSDAKEKTLNFLEEKQVIHEFTTKINEEKKALDELYCSYGKIMYSYEAASEAGMHSATMARKLSAEIGNKRKELEALEAEFEDYKKSIEKKVEPEKVFCTGCGKEFSADEEFCNKCGSKLKRD